MKILKWLAAVIFAVASPCVAFAQSGCPSTINGAVLTAGQWQACFQAKNDVLGFTPLNSAGGTMLGRLVTAPPSSTTAGFNLAPGTAPGSPANGDIWSTSSGVFARAGGSTFNLTNAGLVVGSSPVSGGTSTRVLFDNAGLLGEYTNAALTALINPVTSTLPGAAPASGGGTVNFLRADGTWGVPPGTGGGLVTTTNGGTNANNSTNATNDVLASNGTNGNFVHSALLTLINAVCTLAPTPCAYLFGYWAPEWFGAVCSPQGTAFGSISDSTSAFTAAIAAAAGNLGGTVKAAPCAYKITTGFTIANSNVSFKGSGINQTILVFVPPSAGIGCVNLSAGTGILSNAGISDFSIESPETTLLKIAIVLNDVSQSHVQHIGINHYPVNGTPFSGGGNGIAVFTRGRETTLVEDMAINAEVPIQIAPNTNSPGNGEDMDSWVWRDIGITGQLTSATNPLIQVLSGVSFYNTHFEGRQNWAGGTDAFQWLSSGTFVSQGLYFDGVKDEQPGATGHWTFNIQQGSSGKLIGLHISNSVMDRNGLLETNVVSTHFDSTYFVAGGVGLNADLTNNLIEFNAAIWVSGTTAVLGAFTAGSANITLTGFSTAIPTSGTLHQ